MENVHWRNADMLEAMFFSKDDPMRQKQPRAGSTSATSRKNKLQRCSVCGGLGHKSRTCDAAPRQHPDAEADACDVDDLGSPTQADPRIVMAAYSLLTLHASAAAEERQCPPPLTQTGQEHSNPFGSWPYSPTMLKV